MTALETDEEVRVAVFDSAVEGFFLNHSDFHAKFEDLTGIPQSACSEGLPGEAKAIYDAAAPEFAAAADPRALVKAEVVVLVKAGTVHRGSARSSAMAAGDCLRKLR